MPKQWFFERLPRDLLTRFHAACVVRGTGVGERLIELFQEYIDGRHQDAYLEEVGDFILNIRTAPASLRKAFKDCCATRNKHMRNVLLGLVQEDVNSYEKGIARAQTQTTRAETA